MLSKRLYTVIRLYLPTAAKFGFTGFSWDNHSKVLRKLRVEENQKLIFNFITFIICYIFAIFQCTRFMFYGKDYVKFNICYVYFLGLSVILEYWIIQVYFTKAAIKAFNGILIYLRRINRKTLVLEII